MITLVLLKTMKFVYNRYDRVWNMHLYQLSLVDVGEMGCQKIKISGDGTNISRVSNYIVMLFALLSDEKEVISSKGKFSI